MMHLGTLLLFLLFLPGGARRRVRIDGSRQDAQQQSNTLTEGLDVSVQAREALIPGGYGTGVFRRPCPQAGALREGFKQAGRRVGHLESHLVAPWFPFGPRRAKVALQAGGSPEAGRSASNEDAEAAARRRWLQSTEEARVDRSQQRDSPQDDLMARYRESEEVRKRMLAAMDDGGSLKVKKGEGTAFGFGGADDTYYGYGPRVKSLSDRADDNEGESKWPDWMTRDLAAADAGNPMKRQSHSGGFDGRQEGWARKVESEDPNPPPMANTLRAPGENSIPVQYFEYGIESPSTTQPAGEADETEDGRTRGKSDAPS